MKCNIDCPFAKYNGRNHDGTQDIICTRRNWFRDSSDDCIEGYTEKQMELLKRRYPSHPKERYRVFIEGETGDNVIVDMDEIPPEGYNVASLTLEEASQRLNEQDQKINELEQELFTEKVKRFEDNLAEYGDLNDNEAWQRKFGMTRREANKKAGIDDWELIPEF